MKVISPPNNNIRNNLNADHAATPKAKPVPPHKYNPYPIETKVDPHIAKIDRVRRAVHIINKMFFFMNAPIFYAQRLSLCFQLVYLRIYQDTLF